MIRIRRPLVSRDKNHNAVVGAMRAAGAYVVDLASQGSGCPDTLVGWGQRWMLVEIKNRARWKSDGQLRPSQVTFFAQCESRRLPCHLVTSEAEALALLRHE